MPAPASTVPLAARDDESLVAALVWLVLRTATHGGALDQIAVLVDALSDQRITAVEEAWTALLQDVATIPPAISAPDPPDPEWTTLATLWPRLSVAGRQALVAVARQLPMDRP